MRPVSGSVIGEERTISQRSSPVARTMFLTSSGSGCSPLNSRLRGHALQIELASLLVQHEKARHDRSRAARSSARPAWRTPSRSAAAWLAKTVCPLLVDDGDRLGEVDEDRLQALLHAAAARRYSRALSIASAARRASSHDQLELLARRRARSSPSRSTDSAPSVRPRASSGATTAER